MSEPSCQETFSSFGKMILEDDDTADFIIRCETKEFRVHRTILCARSPVFRASILTDMQEHTELYSLIHQIESKGGGPFLLLILES